LSNTTVLNGIRIGATLVIATLSYFLIETPVRHGAIGRLRLTNRWTFALAPAALAAAAYLSGSLTSRPPETAAALESGEYDCPGQALLCVRHEGSSPTRPVVAVVGDSTARALDPGMMRLSRENDWTYVAAARGGCSIIDRKTLAAAADRVTLNSQCPSDNQNIRDALLTRYRPNVIIAMDRFLFVDFQDETGSVIAAASPGHVQATEDGFEAATTQLTSKGATFVFIKILPVQLPLDCAGQSINDRPDCHVLGSADQLVARYNDLIERIAQRHADTMRVVSLEELVCPNDLCVPGSQGIVLRYDRVHFTRAASVWLAPYIYRKLEEVGALPRPQSEGLSFNHQARPQSIPSWSMSVRASRSTA
jgi:hypothetical protein